ncbi:unnamed protein product [Tilletia caries]|nr:unnamed protein product [Tilletia caries]
MSEDSISSSSVSSSSSDSVSSSSGSGTGSTTSEGNNGLSTSPASSLAAPSASQRAKGSADETFLQGYDAALSGDGAVELPQWAKPHTFHTLETQRMFTNPSSSGLDVADLQDLTAPHIESFNALWEQDPSVDTPQSLKRSGSTGLSSDGLLARAIQRLPSKVVFDGKGTAVEGSEEPSSALGNRLELRIASVTLARPLVADKAKAVHERRVFPSECRERLTTYKARMTAQIDWSVNGQPAKTETVNLGQVPVMVKSNRCNIRGMTSRQLADRMEETTEMGGYFIINGNERLIRFLIVNRANHVVAIDRPSFQNRGPSYSTKGCMIRCLHRDDLTSVTNTVHYLENGGITLRFSWRKQEYMVPIIMVLKALTNATDKDIFSALTQGDFDNTFLSDRIELLLRSFKTYALWTGHQCLEYLGSKFRVVMAAPDDSSNREIGAMLIERLILVHLDRPRDKFNLLIFMMRKLYSLVAGDCCVDNPDSPQHQEILMPGFLYGSIIKERVDEYLTGVRAQIARDVRLKVKGVDFFDGRYITKSLGKVNSDIGARLNNFLATGNLISSTGLDLQQATGFTIIAEKLNFYRYISHFRCVHRGAFFAELKTTTVRKLLPESWGFLCPVHTPDGSPCGLLNHFSHSCRLITRELNATTIQPLLVGLGMTEPIATDLDGRKHVVVQLDGVIIGYATPALAQKMAIALRIWKTQDEMNGVPLDLEIGYVPKSKGGQYPGLYLFSSRARMMRPVRFLHNNKTDSVGPFEQVYLDIACWPEEIEAGVSSHVELSPTNMLSVIANLTPFSDFNQSPRLMYQCQMGKQTMGTPSTALNHRTDNKLYRIQNPQTPLVRPKLHTKYGFDHFPNGTNAIVAVISYTGYDMEDAMILNKSAHERGFGYGTVYKSETVDLKDIVGETAVRSGPPTLHFGIGSDVKRDDPHRAVLDADGLPFVGSKMTPGRSTLCAYYDEVRGRTKFQKYKGDEVGYIDVVRLIGTDGGDSEIQKVQFTIRIPRAPVIGDKFSSRHGQKGVCSQKWPAVDMPFSESGMQPDVIINPHAFPSRMTIGMLIESMAGKAGAMHGLAQDATPWTFSEDDTPVDYFGEQLRAAGYNYVGNEPMYSGITGEEFAADIYLGVVYYQRLRHMVNDKFQVRTTGPVHQLTRQPIKGRKRAGGIRFGEMERDALIAHGTSFLLQDRLMNCSDYSTAWVCRTCGSLISLGFDEYSTNGISVTEASSVSGGRLSVGRASVPMQNGPSGEYCRVCRAEAEAKAVKELDGEAVNEEFEDVDGLIASGHHMTISRDSVLRTTPGGLDVIAVPYVLRYLTAELASMGLKLSFKIE